MRYFKATVEYDGTDFSGFQWQHEIRTVQGELEKALAYRIERPVRVTGAGRTDSGVHAMGQVVSFAAETRIPCDKMSLALNGVLPSDLSIRQVTETEPDFSARFSASSRLYGYLILNRSEPSALWRRYSAFCPQPLNIEAMQAAANYLPGEQDFASFAKETKPGETTMREVLSCRVLPWKNMAFVRIEANAFLRGMVRAIVGTLIEVGTGKRDADSIPSVIASRDRSAAGFAAPARGLCLLKVRYGERRVYARKEITEEQ